MKCPKCSYTSFDYLEKCRKCGADLRDARSLIQIIAVPPDERAPVYSKASESQRAIPALTAGEGTDSLFANDFTPDDFTSTAFVTNNAGESAIGARVTEPEPEAEDDLLAGLNFDQSFDQLVDEPPPAPTAAPKAAQPADDDGLLDLDFDDVFGDSEGEKKK